MSTSHPKNGGNGAEIRASGDTFAAIESAPRKSAESKWVEPRVAPNGVQWLPVPGWGDTGWLWSGFSTRKGGESRAYCADDAPAELNLGFTAADDHETVRRNRRLLAEAITGDEATPFVTARQIHSALVAVVGSQDASRFPPHEVDGLITDEPGILLGIQTADCIPVLVADRKRRVVGAFHAGWRGTVQCIVEAGVGRMRMDFRSQPEDLVAAIGPGIGACCYTVGEEVLSGFESKFVYARELFHQTKDSSPSLQKYPEHAQNGSNLHLDLIEANRHQLLAAGVQAEAIQIVGGCTSCQTELFFSHRAAKGHAGRMLAVIGIRST
jgi:YfiH family protein